MMKAIVVLKDNSKKKISRIINSSGIQAKYSWKNRLRPKDLKNFDLVISIGGDGTMLSASHYLEDKPILGVNSSPGKSIGALTTIPLEKLPEKLEKIKKKIKIEKLERIKVKINSRPVKELALNDVFIANKKAYLTSRYEINYKNKKEKQFSSGLIFSTSTGSKAWFKSAGGKPFSRKIIKMIVREPYRNGLLKSKMNKLKIKNNQKVKIKVLQNSILVIDSIREYKLKENDKVEISISEFPLKRIR